MNKSPKRLCYRCGDCRANFDDHVSLKNHKRTDCPKLPKVEQSSTAESPGITDRSWSSIQKQGELTDSEKASVTLPCFKNLISAAASKKEVFNGFTKITAEVNRASRFYNLALKGRAEAFKSYIDALKRENALSTISSQEEQLIVSDIRARAFKAAQVALQRELSAATLFSLSLSNQKAAIETGVAATLEEQDAFLTVIGTVSANDSGVDSATESEMVSRSQAALATSRDLFVELKRQAEKQEAFVASALKTIASCERFLNESSRVGKSRLVDTDYVIRHRGLLLNCSQVPELMDITASTSDAGTSASTFVTHQRRLPGDS